MVQHALEMEEEDYEEETESLMYEVNGGSSPATSNGHQRGGGGGGSVGGGSVGRLGSSIRSINNNKDTTTASGGGGRKKQIIFLVIGMVGILFLWILKREEIHEEVLTPQDVLSKPSNDDDGSSSTKPTTKTKPPAATTSTSPPTSAPTASPVAIAHDEVTADVPTLPTSKKNDNKDNSPPEKQQSAEAAFVYSKMATIVPDPDHMYSNDTSKLQEKWGKWHFWDGDEALRKAEPLCSGGQGKYENCDVPGDQFDSTAWQVDAVFVNHLLNDAQELVERAMEAIFTEYGHGKPQTPEGLAERMRMFHWEHIEDLLATDKPPAKYAKRGDRGNGGWTTSRSFNGLVQRLLHALMTNGEFVVVLGGHSAAAGHGNHFRQSYVMQFHKIMAPIFARLGVKLITKNMSQGGLGTLQNAMASGDLYGPDIDLLLWDSGMTETNAAHIDLFLRQGLIGGNRVPVVWGGHFSLLRNLHNTADADIGEYGNAKDGLVEIDNENMVDSIPYASRYMKCNHERRDICQSEPRFCARCWIDRPDVPSDQFDHIDDRPGGQVKWHPGWRDHQLRGRALAFAVLDALQMAVQSFSDGTMGGPPLDDDWWHVADYYNNIRKKVIQTGQESYSKSQSGNNDDEKSAIPCLGIAPDLPVRICWTKMHGRSQYTPRYNPHETSLSSIIVPDADGWVPVNEEAQMYEGSDVHNPCYDLPDDAVDVLEIVSGRRRRHLVQDESSTAVLQSPSFRQLNDEIIPGKGWQVVGERPGFCNGEYNSICGRAKSDHCPMSGHHDSRGAVIGNEYAGWLVMELPDVQHGIIVLKLVTYMDPSSQTRTEGWTTVNNERSKGRRDVRKTSASQPPRRLAKLTDLPDSFLFDYSVEGKITTLNKSEFIEFVKTPQRVMEVITLLDDPDFTDTPMNVQIAFRMRECGRSCSIALSHVYWA